MLPEELVAALMCLVMVPDPGLAPPGQRLAVQVQHLADRTRSQRLEERARSLLGLPKGNSGRVLPGADHARARKDVIFEVPTASGKAPQRIATSSAAPLCSISLTYLRRSIKTRSSSPWPVANADPEPSEGR